MLLIGIDEAGYGPILGPLCHGLCVWRFASDGPDDEEPDLWEKFAPLVSRIPAPADAIEIDDSKKVYSGTKKLFRLARSVSLLVEVLETSVPSHKQQPILKQLIRHEELKRIVREPWGRPAVEVPKTKAAKLKSTHPESMALTPDDVRQAGMLGERIKDCQCRLLAYEVRVLSARDFNSRLDVLGNKAEVSWERVGEALLHALRFASSGERVLAVIDRQGGRKFYAAPLGDLFVGAFVRVDHEDSHMSRYRVQHRESEVRMCFREQADATSLPVAMASMAAKLAREILMERFNAFFRMHDKSLKPTAGYFKDGRRFLRETEGLRESLEIPDGHLVRSR